MKNQHESNKYTQSPGFRQGMTLDQYLSSMKTIQGQGSSSFQEDLYSTCRKMQPRASHKVMAYEIRQSDQDNYEESLDEEVHSSLKPLPRSNKSKPDDPSKLKKSTQDLENAENSESADHTNNFRVRCQSKSPLTTKNGHNGDFTRHKILSQTLHMKNLWKGDKQPVSLPAPVTIYGKFLKGIKQKPPKIASKQKHFRKKNSQQFQKVTKFQKQVSQKLSRHRMPDILSMKIQGISDRLCERKMQSLKKGR